MKADYISYTRSIYQMQREEIKKLKDENKRLKKAIEDYGNNPAGFDWAVLERMEQLEEAVSYAVGKLGKQGMDDYIDEINSILGDK